VGILGAGRTRQGLGPFVARELLRAGAELPALCTSRAETAAAACERLRAERGVHARGYADPVEMLEREDLDALAILSPAETHEAHLERALAAKLHVLCEKPLVWGAADFGARGARLAQRFESAGLLLRELCQWPYTRGAFAALHPDVLERMPKSFAMQLAPASTGRQSLGDALPHPLSLLQALAPGDDARAAAPAFRSAQGSLCVAFDYHAGAAAVRAEVELRSTQELPRPAGWALDGHWMRRRVRPQDYALQFESEGRSVPAVDPLSSLVTDFVRDLTSRLGGAPVASARAEIAARARMLESLVRAFDEERAA
jgi:predicted dehydrogenase